MPIKKKTISKAAAQKTVKKPAKKSIRKSSELRILLVNDDGINAPGLASLERIAAKISHDVWVVAPEQQQSAAGHSLTIHRPLRINQYGPRRFAVDGTPTDCALLGLHHLLADKPVDLVLSGVNYGDNVAEDITYSGTIAAAMEATLLGYKAIALSQSIHEDIRPYWDTPEQHAPQVIRNILSVDWPREVLMNVNFPCCGPSKVNGVRVTHQAPGFHLGNRIDKRIDTRRRPYYWIGHLKEDHRHELAADSDAGALGRNYISVTPLHLDLTYKPTMAALKTAFKQKD